MTNFEHLCKGGWIIMILKSSRSRRSKWIVQSSSIFQSIYLKKEVHYLLSFFNLKRAKHLRILHACATLFNDRSGEVHVTSISFYQGKSCVPLSVRSSSLLFPCLHQAVENAICKLSCTTIVRMKGKFTRKKHGGTRGLKKSRAN